MLLPMQRAHHLARLKSGQLYDLVVVGGGATGCGIALEASTRGLRVALIDQGDLAEGTSMKSTKLVHGGVRYLEKAIMELDAEQWDLVKEGLFERGLLLQNAPHLAHPIRFVTPLYSWWQLLKVYIGLWLYDRLSGTMRLGPSRLISGKAAKTAFPGLKQDGLKGLVSYVDGQFQDTRMAVALAQSAERAGASICTHTRFEAFQKEEGRIVGCELEDRLGGGRFRVRCRGLINATGVGADHLRRLDDPKAPSMLRASSGVHLVLKAGLSPSDRGLLIPETEDGRVLFVLPWLGHTLVGTTDDPKPTDAPLEVTEAEIDYLLRQLAAYFEQPVSRDSVLAAWTGLRPLVFDPKAKHTEALVRSHLLVESQSRLLTVIGGKWTSYRAMGEDAVDRAIELFSLLGAGPSVTRQLRLVGSAADSEPKAMSLEALIEAGVEPDVAEHWIQSYGDQARKLLDLKNRGYDARLLPELPYLTADVIHAIRAEFAARAIDVVMRRLNLGLLDQQAAIRVLPQVVSLMAKQQGWDKMRQSEELALAENQLKRPKDLRSTAS